MGLPDCLQEVGQGRRPICVPCLLEREDGIGSSLSHLLAQPLTVKPQQRSNLASRRYLKDGRFLPRRA